MTDGDDEFLEKGWRRIKADPEIADWAAAVLPVAKSLINDPAHGNWLRCGATWFVGVNLLPNDKAGAIPGTAPLPVPIASVLKNLGLPTDTLDRAQLSVIYPGYPRPSDDESRGAFLFRRDRDAAHVDGLLPVGPKRRRMLREPHAFVLGIPLTETNAEASPMVIWEGSHKIMRCAFAKAFANHAPDRWPDIDVTDIYQAARRQVFETCKRVVVHANPGAAYIVHRLAVHGVAPWGTGATAPQEGRIIAYFRPEGEMRDWLDAP